MSAEAGHSFSKRFSYKLAANVLGALINFLQASLVSRALGPLRYGDFNFLSSFFWQVIVFLDMRSSTWLYIQVSAKRERTRVIGFYFLLALAISAIALLLPLAAAALNIHEILWPGQNSRLVLLVSLLALTIWYADLFGKLCDALGLTVSMEKARVLNRIVFFLALVLLVRLALLDIHSFIGLQMLGNAVLIAVLFLVLRRTAAFRHRSLHPARVDARENLAGVYAYSHPIFVYTLLALGSTLADRWLLQTFGGSVEQGLFSLALYLGLAFNIIVDALHPLMMREFSVAFAENDLPRAAEVFRQVIPSSYMLSAFFLCFAAVFADVCVRIFGGSSYRDAAAVFAILAFFPIVANYSTLSGSAMYAANRTRLLRNIGLFTTPVGVLATFFLLAPAEYGGWNQGAVGLAAKMVVLEFIGNNIVLFFVARMLKLSFARYLAHQVAVVAVLTAAAFVCRQAAALALARSSGEWNWLLEMLMAGTLYSGISFVLFFFAPAIAGVDRREALALVRSAWQKLMT